MNIIRMAIELLVVLAFPVIEVEQKHGSAPAGSTPEQKEAHRKMKTEEYNRISDEWIDNSVAKGIIPGWLAGIAKKLNDQLAGILVRIANYHKYFEHEGNPPGAGQ